MANNKDFSSPPLTTDIQTDGAMPSAWQSFFTNYYFNLSVKNNQTTTAACEINLDARYVALTSAGSGYAVTLAAPTIPGVYKTIHKTSSNADNITMLLTNCFGQPSGTTVTWNSVNDILVLVSVSNSKWYIVSYNGVAYS